MLIKQTGQGYLFFSRESSLGKCPKIRLQLIWVDEESIHGMSSEIQCGQSFLTRCRSRQRPLGGCQLEEVEGFGKGIWVGIYRTDGQRNRVLIGEISAEECLWTD